MLYFHYSFELSAGKRFEYLATTFIERLERALRACRVVRGNKLCSPSIVV